MTEPGVFRECLEKSFAEVERIVVAELKLQIELAWLREWNKAAA